MADDSELTDEERTAVNHAWRNLMRTGRTVASCTTRCQTCAGWRRLGLTKFQKTLSPTSATGRCMMAVSSCIVFSEQKIRPRTRPLFTRTSCVSSATAISTPAVACWRSLSQGYAGSRAMIQSNSPMETPQVE